jgi:hypothetical protein
MSEQLRDKMFEQLVTHERHKPTIYIDTKKHNNATIGVGYTPVVEGIGGKWTVRPEAEADFKAAGITLTEKHKRAFEELAYAKNNPKAKDAEQRQNAALDKLGDINVDEKQAKALSGRLIDEGIAHAEKSVGKDRFNKLDEGRKSALAGAAYQSPANIRRIGPELGKAIDAKDWNKAAKVLEDSGKRLGDPSRYKSYGTEMRDPVTPGKIQAHDGDSLWSLAQQHGTTVKALQNANPDIKKNGSIRAGDYINLPPKGTDEPMSTQELEPQTTEPPVSDAPQASEPPVTEEPQQAEPEQPQENQAELGKDGRAFQDKLAQPVARPGLAAALKDPGQWTKEERDSVVQDYMRYQRPQGMNDWLREQTTEHFRQTNGEDVKNTLVQTPDDLRRVQKMLEQLSRKFAPAFDADGMSDATKAMQRGLNLINQDKMPKLKEDGDWGPITDFSFKKSANLHNPARLDEGFALGRLQTLAEKPQMPEDLSKRTQDILGPLYGSQADGKDTEPHHAIALQAGLNEIGPKYADPWQPLKLDGEIGPKTTDAFNQIASAAGPQSFTQQFGNWLGWLS